MMYCLALLSVGKRDGAPLPHPHSCAPSDHRRARTPMYTPALPKQQRLREHACVVNKKAGAGRNRLSTLVHVHGDTTNVSVRGGERERAHLRGS